MAELGERGFATIFVTLSRTEADETATYTKPMPSLDFKIELKSKFLRWVQSFFSPWESEASPLSFAAEVNHLLNSKTRLSPAYKKTRHLLPSIRIKIHSTVEAVDEGHVLKESTDSNNVGEAQGTK